MSEARDATPLRKTDLVVLRGLAELHEMHPNAAGFRASKLPRGGDGAICRKFLEPRGLVRVTRLKPSDFRYALTDAGRAVLVEFEAGKS
jgi:hypothetical protein